MQDSPRHGSTAHEARVGGQRVHITSPRQLGLCTKTLSLKIQDRRQCQQIKALSIRHVVSRCSICSLQSVGKVWKWLFRLRTNFRELHGALCILKFHVDFLGDPVPQFQAGTMTAQRSVITMTILECRFHAQVPHRRGRGLPRTFQEEQKACSVLVFQANWPFKVARCQEQPSFTCAPYVKNLLFQKPSD